MCHWRCIYISNQIYATYSLEFKEIRFCPKSTSWVASLNQTDVRNRTKNLSQRKHGWRNTKRGAPGNIVSLERTGIRYIGCKYVLYIISTTKLCVNITVVRIFFNYWVGYLIKSIFCFSVFLCRCFLQKPNSYVYWWVLSF